MQRRMVEIVIRLQHVEAQIFTYAERFVKVHVSLGNSLLPFDFDAMRMDLNGRTCKRCPG